MTKKKYKDYPFIANGVNLISRVYNNTEIAKLVAGVPTTVLDDLNRQAVQEIIGDVSKLDFKDLQIELQRVNAGATEAFIILGEN